MLAGVRLSRPGLRPPSLSGSCCCWFCWQSVGRSRDYCFQCSPIEDGDWPAPWHWLPLPTQSGWAQVSSSSASAPSGSSSPSLPSEPSVGDSRQAQMIQARSRRVEELTGAPVLLDFSTSRLLASAVYMLKLRSGSYFSSSSHSG